MNIVLKYFLRLSLLIAFASGTQAQQAVQWLGAGEQALLNGQTAKALKYFQQAVRENQSLLTAHRFIGVCYELNKAFEPALEKYRYVIGRDSLFSRGLYFEAGMLCYKTGRYAQALTYFRQFEELQRNPVAMYKLRGEREIYAESGYLLNLPAAIRACEIALDSIQWRSISGVRNLDKWVNTRADEYFPMLLNDQQTMLFTRRMSKDADEDLYSARRIDGVWQSGISMPGTVNTRYHEGMSAMVKSGKKIYFTACGRPSVAGACDIWEAIFDAAVPAMAEQQPLLGSLNSEQWESQATVSCDGQWLYFASNRPGGLGGTDIWYSMRDGYGHWTEPRNAGPYINSAGDEEAPFLANDGQALFFSSTGHPGMGEQDLFVVWRDADGNWTPAVNLGPPVNSAYREIGINITADGKTGYFASDRPEGFGGMDMYTFELSDQLQSRPITYVEGSVRDAILDIPLQVVLQIDPFGNIATDEEGRFFLCVPAGETVGITTERPFYQSFEASFRIPDWDNTVHFPLDILLTPLYPGAIATERDAIGQSDSELTSQATRKVMTHSVFFDFDKSTVSTESITALEKFMTALKAKQVDRLEIIGFADDIGTEVYNLKLSEERARQVALALMSNQIAVHKIYLEGKGKEISQLPREKSRRVDIKVILLE